MGDRYVVNGKCAYCGKAAEDAYFAPTCGISTYRCGCGKTSYISSNHSFKRLECVTLEDLKESFKACTNVNWSEKDIDGICERQLADIKEAATV